MYTNTQDHLNTAYDVLVIGAGNAGICAAISAAEAGCSVLVVEAAPRDMRGGNTRHTRNLRAMHYEPTDVLTDRYSFEEYFDDLMRVTKGVTESEAGRNRAEGICRSAHPAEPAGGAVSACPERYIKSGPDKCVFSGRRAHLAEPAVSLCRRDWHLSCL